MTDRRPNPESLLPLTHLALEILLALAEGPRHGYGIITDIEERSGGRTSLRSGTLYTAIQRLRSDGLLEPAESSEAGDDPRRKYFQITPFGRTVARLELERLSHVVTSGRRRALLGSRAATRSGR